MSKRTHDFLEWVTDPARTGDELFTVELLLEGLRLSMDWPFRERGLDFREDMRRRRAQVHPGYRPDLPRDALKALAARAATVTRFHGPGLTDRPLRDLTALGFFLALEDVNLSGCDVADLSPLAVLSRVTRLSVAEYSELVGAHELDFAQLATSRRSIICTWH